MPVPYQGTPGWSEPQFTRVVAPLVTAKTFPCSVSSLWRFVLHHHPSPLDLRQASNGDRHLEVGAGSALETRAPTVQSTIRAHSPRSGDRRARPRPGLPCEDSNLEWANSPTGQKCSLHQNMVQTLRRKQKLAAERSSMGTRRERPEPCLPLRSDHPCSSSVVEEPSDLENQIGRLYFRSDPVKYCTTQNIISILLSARTHKVIVSFGMELTSR